MESPEVHEEKRHPIQVAARQIPRRQTCALHGSLPVVLLPWSGEAVVCREIRDQTEREGAPTIGLTFQREFPSEHPGQLATE